MEWHHIRNRRRVKGKTREYMYRKLEYDCGGTTNQWGGYVVFNRGVLWTEFCSPKYMCWQLYPLVWLYLEMGPLRK